MVRRSLLIAAIAFSALACHRPLSQPSRQTPVILISIDTLRSDHLPAYGYRSVETPAIDAFRKDAVLFERAWAHVPLTLPSHATILTGQLPARNGVRDNLGFHFAADVPTIAELLKKNGYATGGAVSAFVLRGESGVGRGFEWYDDQIDPGSTAISVGRVQRKGAETVALAEHWLTSVRSRPFFLFLHLYEPHSPYDAPEPYRTRFPRSYDAEIAYVDSVLAEFLTSLKKEGVYDKALIILLSDHGEGLGQHGEDEHGIFLYREALQVPLIVKFPDGSLAGRSVSSPAELIDVFPTIAKLTATPSGPLPGMSLLDLASGGVSDHRVVYSETMYPRYHFGWSELHSLIDEANHYIEGPKPELFDLRGDPQETRNLAGSDRRTLTTMRTQMQPMVTMASQATAVAPEDAARLAALGYLGSGSAVANGALPDPRDRIATYPLIRHAFTAYDAGRFTEALAACQELTRQNPGMVDLYDMEARTLEQLGRVDEAIAAAEAGLRANPRSVGLALMVSKMSLEKGDIATAEKHADLAMSGEPGAAHDLLARAALARHDLARAEREANAALQSREFVLALMTLARVEIERKNLAAALQFSDRALAAVAQKRGDVSMKGLYFLRGDILARMSRNEEAETAFRREIALFPGDAPAYQNLILLLVSENRLQESTGLVFALAKAAPTPPSFVAIATTLRTIGDVNGARYWRARGLQLFPDDPSLRKLAAG